MENITAIFSNWTEMESAADSLRAQGAIDILLFANGQNPDGAAESLVSGFTNNSIEPANPEFRMQVVIESSRYRQAEDTITRFGGQTGG
jgi:hypothetical protein